MYLDKQLEMSDAQTFTTGTNASTNSIDTSEAGDAGVSLWLEIRIAVAIVGGSGSTIQIQAIHDSDSAFGTTPVTFFDSGAVAWATLIAGYEVVKMRLPANMQRWIKCSYIVAVADITGGAVDAFLTPDADHKTNYSN